MDNIQRKKAAIDDGVAEKVGNEEQKTESMEAEENWFRRNQDFFSSLNAQFWFSVAATAGALVATLLFEKATSSGQGSDASNKQRKD